MKLINMRENVKSMTNDELYKQYHKLVYFIIHKWSTKPLDYAEHVDDIANEVFMRLFSIPIHGTRRNNPSYINTTIQTTIAYCFNKIKKIDGNVPFGLFIDFQSEEFDYNDIALFDKRSEQSIKEVDSSILLNQIYENLLNLDEKIVVTAFLDLGYRRKCIAVKDIARMIYKDKEETQMILDNALEKIKEHLLSI